MFGNVSDAQVSPKSKHEKKQDGQIVLQLKRWKASKVNGWRLFGAFFFGQVLSPSQVVHPQLVKGRRKCSSGLPIYRFGSSFWGEAFAGHHTSASFHAVLTACAAGVSWRQNAFLDLEGHPGCANQANDCCTAKASKVT